MHLLLNTGEILSIRTNFFNNFLVFNDFFVFYLMIFSLSVFIVLGFINIIDK